MKIFYDTEFLEDGHTIQLISIGMVREDGKTYYGVVADPFLINQASQNSWLEKNVISHLPYKRYGDTYDFNAGHDDYKSLKFRWVIREEVKKFVLDTPNVELWGYYPSYDHVVVCQLFGRMVDLPVGFPMFTNCVQQERVRLGNVRLPEQLEGAHNALSDARWTKEAYEYLQELQNPAQRLTRAKLLEVANRVEKQG